jgi:hypothetical protein
LDGPLPPIEAGKSLGADGQLGVESLGGAGLAGVQLAIKAIIELPKINSAMLLGVAGTKD